MLEILTEPLVMKEEIARVVLAVIFTSLTTYYDIFNNKNVPDGLLYVFLGVAVVMNIITFNNTAIFGFVVGAVVFGATFLIYKAGYLGGADVFVLTSIAILLPVFPSWVALPINIPFILSLLVTSGFLFSFYFLLWVVKKVILKGKRGKMHYLLLIPFYIVMLYFFHTTGIFDFTYLAIVFVLLLSSSIFTAYRESILESMVEEIPIEKVENEDIAAVEFMDKKINRLLDEKEIEKLKREGVKKIKVYTKLPPYLPFIFIALLILLTYGDLLFNSIKVV